MSLQPKSCARRTTNKALVNKKSAPNHGAASSKGTQKAPSKGRQVKKNRQRRPREEPELEIRAPTNIQLCGVPFRGTSATNGCDNKKGFYQSKWTEWDVSRIFYAVSYYWRSQSFDRVTRAESQLISWSAVRLTFMGFEMNKLIAKPLPFLLRSCSWAPVNRQSSRRGRILHTMEQN